MTLASVGTLAAVAAALCCRCGFTLLSLVLDEATLAAVAAALGCSCGCAWLQLRLRLAAVSCDSGWFVGREKAEASAAAAAAAAAAEMKLV